MKKVNKTQAKRASNFAKRKKKMETKQFLFYFSIFFQFQPKFRQCTRFSFEMFRFAISSTYHLSVINEIYNKKQCKKK